MHEMSLAEGIMQIVEDQGSQAGNKVTSVTLSIGELAGIEIESLRFCFDVVSRQTLAEGAALEIESVPGSAFCFDCIAQVPHHNRGDACERCGGHKLTVVDGAQMKVKSLEVE